VLPFLLFELLTFENAGRSPIRVARLGSAGAARLFRGASSGFFFFVFLRGQDGVAHATAELLASSGRTAQQ
jgi:hypothetical protein